MKILCAYSSIEFNCEHFPGTLNSREVAHPIFYIPQKRLLSYTGKWAAGELTPIDSYLLFLSLLNSSDLVNFRVPAIRTPDTDSIIALNMEPLTKILIRLNIVPEITKAFPSYVITPETKDLSNVQYWIQNWKEAYKDFKDGYISANESQKLIHRELALERLIKNPHKPISSYARQLSEWAAVAGKFPEWKTSSPFTGKTLSCSELWQEIIIRASKEESIFSVPRIDLEDLLEHCECNIPIGSIFSNALFTVLRKALEKQKNFLGLGDINIGKVSYTILQADTSPESFNMLAMINSAPPDKPKQEDYPNKLSYLKAKLRYEAAINSGSRNIQEVPAQSEQSAVKVTHNNTEF